MSLRKATGTESEHFGYLLASAESPLRRSSPADARLQKGKERNVTLAAARIDGIVVGPCQVFSYHHLVGRPSRLRGFRMGLELKNGRPSRGIGGGCCQVSNMLYQLALHAGMKVVERHRHGLDIFPDQDRRIPFGLGATVFYNCADLRIENPLPHDVMVRLMIHDGLLTGEIRSSRKQEFQIEVYENWHRFSKDDCGWIRENHIRRRIRKLDGALILDQEVAHNRGRVLYDPDEIR